MRQVCLTPNKLASSSGIESGCLLRQTAELLNCQWSGRTKMYATQDLELLLDRQTPIIVIESWDEPRVLELITRLGIIRGLSMRQWSLTDGLRRLGFGEEPNLENSESPDVALMQLKLQEEGGLFVFCDLHPFLDQPGIVRLLKDIALQHEGRNKTLILLSHQLDVPAEIQRLVARFRLQMPTDEQLMKLIQEEARHYGARSGKRVKVAPGVLKQLVTNVKGLPFSDARRLVRGAIVDDGAITESDIPAVAQARMQLMDMQGVLRFEFDTARFGDVAGLNNLKRWLEQRRSAFLSTHQQRIDKPKGVLLFGIQGGGKSLAAKAVAGSWRVPLLNLDMGALYNKFIGETERNLRESLQLAKRLAPCVLWIDEIEKGLSSGQNDGGVSQRLLGTLLTWLADQSDGVFVVATANNIHELPPELIRKGRLDEIFFVDLPDLPTRKSILSLHLARRGIRTESIDLNLLAREAEGFSGAELEQVVVSACYGVSGEVEQESQNMDTSLLLERIHSTLPLSVTMSEQLEALRQWAEGRAVRAN